MAARLTKGISGLAVNDSIYEEKYDEYPRGNDHEAKKALENKLSTLTGANVRSSRHCPQYRIAIQICSKIFNEIPAEFFDSDGNACYCSQCHQKRGDKMTYYRGNPPKKYVLPIGWVRFGLQTGGYCKINNRWDKWHVAYHGTTKEKIPTILASKGTLLPPGHIALDGYELGVRDGHIKSKEPRENTYTGKLEMFDPNQVYCSPSIVYAGRDAYAKSFVCDHPSKNGKKVSVKVAFQLRIKPGSYDIGPETVGAAEKKIIIDKHFSNNELEWHTKQTVGHVLSGLLFHIVDDVKETNKLPSNLFIYGALGTRIEYHKMFKKLGGKVIRGEISGFKLRNDGQSQTYDPYAIETGKKNDCIIGKIMVFDDDVKFSEKLQAIDRIEGYDPHPPSFCNRTVVAARNVTGGGKIDVILYYQDAPEW